jgi:hypothetical protein
MSRSDIRFGLSRISLRSCGLPAIAFAVTAQFSSEPDAKTTAAVRDGAHRRPVGAPRDAPRAIFYGNFKLICLSSPGCKNNPLRRDPKSPLQLPPIPSREEGRWPSSRTLGRVAVDAAAPGARGVRRAGFRERISRADERRLNASAMASVGRHSAGWSFGGGSCVRQNRVVLAPVAGVKPAQVCKAQPGNASRQFAGDGGKTNSSPGRARHKPSNHCAGNAGLLRLYLYARVRILKCILHTRPRVLAGTRHSLCPLNFGRKIIGQPGRNVPRECGRLAD